jgi:hypothetical protein
MIHYEKHTGDTIQAGWWSPYTQHINTQISYFSSRTKQMHNISNLFNFGSTLYMFRTVSPSIIRSLKTVLTASGMCHTGFPAAC